MHPFKAAFGTDPAVSASAPGRVNLLGEHTDYNDGFVLPTAIPQTTTVDAAPSPTGMFELQSRGIGIPATRYSFAAGASPPAGYPQYVHGCIRALHERGIEVPPVAMLVRSTVPIGAGLSSSAALEIAVLRALRMLLRYDLDDVELALTAQRAESHYVGVRCGIMDQMASSLADPRHMIFLDTRTLERRKVAFPARTEIVVLDSGVPRALASSGYNQRRSECEAAARALGVPALRDVADAAAAASLPVPLDRRARHVITENSRVLQAGRGLTAERFGQLMNESHASLRDDFEVSIEALDALVAELQAHTDVHGARLTGAGFGGACVALVRAGAATQVKHAVLARFAARGHHGAALV